MGNDEPAAADATAEVPESLQHVLIHRLPDCSTIDTARQLRLSCKELCHAVNKNITRCVEQLAADRQLDFPPDVIDLVPPQL
jgi:hypothetical protein